jgi:hypothetical protein
MENNAVLGQKYAYATMSLVLGILSFVNFLGMEKGILAIVFGAMALRSLPQPALGPRRAWARLGLAFGALQIVVIVAIVAFNWETLLDVIRHLERLGEGR